MAKNTGKIREFCQSGKVGTLFKATFPHLHDQSLLGGFLKSALMMKHLSLPLNGIFAGLEYIVHTVLSTDDPVR